MMHATRDIPSSAVGQALKKFGGIVLSARTFNLATYPATHLDQIASGEFLLHDAPHLAHAGVRHAGQRIQHPRRTPSRLPNHAQTTTQDLAMRCLPMRSLTRGSLYCPSFHLTNDDLTISRTIQMDFPPMTQCTQGGGSALPALRQFPRPMSSPR